MQKWITRKTIRLCMPLSLALCLAFPLAFALAFFGVLPLRAQNTELLAKVILEGRKPVTYSLNYQEYPGLVAAFLYISQLADSPYRETQYTSKSLSSYGKDFSSLPQKLYSLPNTPSASKPRPGLAFWRSSSILRSDILVQSTREVGVRDQNNLVFFAELQRVGEAIISQNKGLELISVEAQGPAAEIFLANLSSDRANYLASLEQLWQENLRTAAPEVYALLQQSEDWQRDAFGYYIRTVKRGKGRLPQHGEDLNISIRRKAFAKFQAQSLPVIVGFGKDALPMPFSYFVAQTPKGSRVEILCPPSAARRHLARLPAEYGGTRYQWLLDSYAENTWLYLDFSLEIP